jgi:adenosylhomocysteine nucleosidase
MTHRTRLLLRCAVALLSLVGWAAQGQTWLDSQPRTAIVSAFEPELTLLRSQLKQPKTYRVAGVEFFTGQLQGKPVLLFLSGVSMVNAAMNTQRAADLFKLKRMLFSGIAGGVNPALHIGDVAVPQRWAQYLEGVMARETGPNQYTPPGWMDDVKLAGFGAYLPRPVEVRSGQQDGVGKKMWFEVDPGLLATAQRIVSTPLQRCDDQQHCLSRVPQVVVGGQGVSGSWFVDNAAFRQYSFDTFAANVLDMETASAAQVAYSNQIPFIAFRSLSDLAGGGDGENEMTVFTKLAANNSARVLLAFLAAHRD